MKLRTALGRATFGAATSVQLWAAVAAFTGGQALLAATPALACAYEPLIGSVCFTAADFCPLGFVQANGQLLPLNGNQALYSLVGTRYGGDGKTTFGVPDLRARSVVGVGKSPEQAASIALAQKIGAQQLTLISSQVPLVTHTHAATFVPTYSGVTANIPATPSTLAVTSALNMKMTQGVGSPPANTNGYYLGLGGSGNQQAPIYVPGTSTAATVTLGGLDVNLTGAAGTAATTATFKAVSGGTVTNAYAGSTAANPVSTQSPALGLTACIAANGIYPDRP